MKQKNIFFDLDGMKFDTMPAQVDYVNTRYDIKTIAEDHIGHNNDLDLIIKKHRPDITLSRDEIYHDFGINFISSLEWHKNVQPMKDMPKVVRELSKQFTLFVATARQKRGLPIIQHLLTKHVPGCISLVHCVWEHNDKGVFVGISKRDFIAKIPGDNIGFFDDSLHEIKETEDIIPSYLFDPMKAHMNTEGILRVESWENIGNLFL